MWGEPGHETILAVHGLQDNANTFDRLVPLLLNGKPSYSFLSIDLPGHGLSSHFPVGRPIYFMDMVSSVYRVIQWMLKRQNGMDSILYIGHSFGGQIGLYVASVFPECIRKLVVIDALIPSATNISKFFRKFQSAQKKMEELEDKVHGTSAPMYTYEEALNKIKSRFHGDLTDGSAEILLSRSTHETEHKQRSFVMDQRLKFVAYHPFTKEQQFELFTKIICPIQLIVAEETRLAGGGYYTSRMEVFNKCSAPCSIYPVEGNHDVHLEHPERVCPLVQQFLLRHKSFL